MPKQSALDYINRQVKEDQEQGVDRHQHYSTIDTINEMLEEDWRKEQEKREREYQRQYGQFQGEQNADLADWIRGMSPTALADDAQQRRLEAAKGIYTSDIGEKKTGRGRSLETKLVIPSVEGRQISGTKKQAADTYSPRKTSQSKLTIDPSYTRGSGFTHKSGNLLADDVDEASKDLTRETVNTLGSAMALSYTLQAKGQNPYGDSIPGLQQNVENAWANMQQAQQNQSNAQQRYNDLATAFQRQEENRKYGGLRNNENFAALSVGDEETARRGANSPTKNLGEYYQIYHRKDISLDPSKPESEQALYADTELRYLTDDEAAVYFYLWNKENQGPGAAHAYLETIRPRLNERRQEERQKFITGYSRENPGAASAASVIMNTGSILGVIDLTQQNIRRMLGDRKPIDYNSSWQDLGREAANIRKTVSDKIAEDHPGSANLATFLYMTGMSIADSLPQTLAAMLGAPPALTTAMLGLQSGSAALQAVYDAKDRGASDGQALLYGYAAGIAEYVFEKISLDNFVDSFVSKNNMSIGQKLFGASFDDKYLDLIMKLGAAITDIGVQGGVEASEEGFTTLANTITDLMINQDKSELIQSIQTKIKDARELNPKADPVETEKNAIRLALKEWVTSLGMDALGGLVSGGFYGVTGAGFRGGVNAVGRAAGNAAAGAQNTMAIPDVQNRQPAVAPPLPQTAQIAPERATTPPVPGNVQRDAENAGRTGNDLSTASGSPPLSGEARTENGPPVPQNRAVNAETQQTTERSSQMPVQNQQETAQERTTPPLPRQAAQEQQERASTPPVPQSVQTAQETAQEDLSAAAAAPPLSGEARTEERTAAPEGEVRKQTKAQQTVATQRKRAMADSTAVSLQSRGFTEAGAQETAFIREEAQMDAEERAVTEALRAEGLEPTLFTGLVTNADGKKVSILQDGNRVALQADNRSRSLTSMAEEVLGHPIASQQTSDLSTAARSPSPEGAATREIPAGEARSTSPAPAQTAPPLPRSQTAGLRTKENPRAQAARESALQAGASEETANQVARLAKILKKDIRCVNEPERNGAVKNGWTQDGVIYYNVAGNERPLAWVVGHELTHNTEHAKTYEKLAALTKRVYGKQWDAAVRQLMAEREEVARRLGDANVKIDQEETEREIVANFFADNLLTNEDMIREVVENDAPTARRILNYLKDLLRKWQGKEPTIERAIDLYSKALKEVAAGAQEKGAARGGLTVGTPARSAQDIKNRKYSVQSIFNAAGFQVTMKGGRVIATDGNGQRITEMTEDMVRRSGIGTMIRYAQEVTKSISKAEAQTQVEGLTRLFNLMLKAQDGDMVWRFAGSAMFSAVKSNSDGQYSTTVDFSTVCKKTEEMMRTMSTVMMRTHKGLTKDQIIELQNDILAENGLVPCPVCYVFSRWAGVGGILDNMAKFQKKYDGAEWDDPARMKARIDQLKAATKTKKALQALLMEEDNAYQQFTGELEANQAEQKTLRAEKKSLTGKKADAAANAARVAEIDKRLKELDGLNALLKADIQAIEKSGAPEAAWLERVRSKPTYREEGYVEEDLLYNLLAADRLAEEKPLAWGYRTSRGPSAGKAILPYSDMRVGDWVLGPKANSAKGANPLFSSVGEQFSKDQTKAIDAAKMKVLAQNLIGGQRYQSTSDFMYDYGLDYLLSFFEGQMLGSKMQTYTKVMEFVNLVASVHGDVNISMMPLDAGYVTEEDGRQHLIYSSVTGANPEAAIRANHLFDNAQLILVGINDQHILLALEDSEETGGSEIGFVIPYHASGASINNFIRGLVENLKETFDEKNYKNYEPMQNDSHRKNATATQEARERLRRYLLTGKRGKSELMVMTGNPNGLTDTEMKLLKGRSKDISDRSFEELREIEKRALAGDKAAIKEYESWSAGFLGDLYKKMWTDQKAKDTYGVRLTGDQPDHIMPHEFWDTRVDREHAYINGFRFRSYCYSLGLTPRFTGINSAGKHLGYGDFSDSKGYWKTLIDRPMYDRSGKYRDQQTMNVTELSGSISEENAGMLSPEYGREFWGENAQTPDTGVAARAAERYLERNGEKPQFSAELRKDVVNRLDKQVKDGDYVIVYHSMYRDKDGNLYSPMAGKKKVGNQWVLTNPYNLNTWYKSDAPENIADLIENGSVKLKDNGQWSFNLKKPDKSGDVPAALNPWNHASTDALNDQFTSAYERENDEGELVTVECIIPLSEVDQSVAVDPETGKVETKPYEEKGMVTDRDVMAKPDSQNKKLKQPTLIAKGTTINPKDSVGLKMWKAGPVHGQISGKRPVYLSRWIRNTRVLSTEETAKMIAQTLKKEGFTGEIPGNVVGLKLRQALEAEGVKFGKPQSSVSKGYYSYMAEHGYSRAQANGEPLGNGRSYSAELKKNKTPSFEYMKPFAEQLKDFMDKEKRAETFGNDALLIGTTPQIFQDIGLVSLPVAINQTHVKYVTDRDYSGKEEFKAGHTFDIDEFAKLPEKLADPVAIIADASRQDLVVYVEMRNESGNQTIVPFRVDTKTNLGDRSVDVQLAKSVYGGEDADSILAAAIGRDSADNIRVYYVNKSKIPPKISAAVREYGRTVPDGIIHTINEPGAPVKGQKKSKLETSQFKNWFKGSKVVDSNGNPKIVYHQTAARFWTFNTDNPVAAKNDSETPNGIFFKDNDHDIGIGGDRQMAVYLAMRKPLQFKNREAANKWYQKHIDGYAQLQDQMKAALSPFDAELNEIENEMFAEGTTDEQYEELNKKWDAKLDQMREVEDKYRGQLRELLNDYFLKNDSGFDGIILDYDGHRYVDGKRENVKTYIVFKNTQIKSATDNIGLYDPKNPDIRYSAELTDRERSTEALEGRLLGSRELLGTPALKKLGVKVSGSVGRYANTEQLKAKNKAAKQLKKAAADAEKRLQATEAEKDFASGIAAMVYDEEDIPARLRRDVVMELADYYFASDSANLDTLAKIRADINAGLRAEAGDLLEEADFKPQSMLKLNERTPERNFRAMFGERGDEITEWLVQPVRENEAEKIRWFNAQLDKVREFEDSKGKKRELTRQESALTMKYMEGTAAAQMIADLETDPKNRYGKQTAKNIKNAATNIRNGESAADAAKEFSLGDREKDLAAKYAAWQNTLQELKESDSTIVENAAKAYAELFDQYYEAINDFLVAHGYEPIGYIKGYAPHMQPEATQTMLEKALGALGVNAEVKELPASIAGQTAIYKPNKRWNPYFLQRTGSTAEYDIVKAFESYVDYMADIFYHTDDIMRARQMVRWIRQSFAPEEIRSKLDYIDTIRQAPTEVKTNLLRDAGEIGKTTVMSPMDTEAAMQEYVDKLFEQAKNTSKYSNLVMWLENYANILAGKQSFADRGWEYSTGRKSLNTFNRLNNAFQKSNVAGNLSSVINQTAQLPMIAAELGERDFLGGLVDVVTGKAKNWAQDSDFLTEKEGKDYLYADNADKFIDALYKPASWMDHLVSTVAVRGAFDKAIRQGKSYEQAMRYADDFGRKLMGSRAKGSRPLAYESKGAFSKMVHMFQVECANSWDHIASDLPYEIKQIAKTQGKGKAATTLAALIIRALLGAFLLNRTAEEIYGGTPAPFDILGLAANFVASGQGLTTNRWMKKIIDNGMEKLGGERIFGTKANEGSDEFSVTTAGEELLYNVMNDLPLARNVAGLFGLGDQTVPLPGASGEFKDVGTAISKLLKDGVDEGELADLLRATLKAASQFAPGGRQIRKTAEGAEAVIRGGSYKSGKLQYPVKGAADTARALAFGKNATQAARDFWAAGGKALSEKQTGVYQGLVDEGMSQQEAYDTITGYRDEGNLDDYVKWTDSRSRDAGVDEGTYLQFREDTKGITGDPDGKGSIISGTKKAKIVGYIDGLDLTPEQKTAMLLDYNSTYSLKDVTWSGGEPAAAAAPEEPAKVSEMRSTLTGIGIQDQKVDALAPVLGGDGSNTSKWRAVADQKLGKEKQDQVLKTIMTEAMYRNWTIAEKADISLDSYVKGREAYKDLDESGTDQNSEWTAALETVTFDSDSGRDNYIKGVLWQIYTGSSSTKNNPFDKAGGQMVLDAKKGGGGSGSGSYAMARLVTQRTPDAPRAAKPRGGLVATGRPYTARTGGLVLKKK